MIFISTKSISCSYKTFYSQHLRKRKLQSACVLTVIPCKMCLLFNSSLHFEGIYLLRCFIAHVTGSIRLTDTAQS